jgi:hypothetical protein
MPRAQGRWPAGAGALLVALASLLLLCSAMRPEAASAVSKVPKGAVKKLRRAPCPPAYAVRVARPADPSEVSDAKHGRFDINGVNVQITRHMNWAYDPVGSASFRARLHDLRWLDILFYAWRENHDKRALRVAKRIVVDWVKQNKLKRPVNDRAWFDKVAGDRIAYIAYATRASACAGLLKQGRLARLLLGSVEQHLRFLGDRKRYSPTNRGLFMDLGLIFGGRQMRFLPGATKARNRGARRFVSNVRAHVIPGEGMWLEHSSTYQFLTISAIERYLEVEGGDPGGLKELLPTMQDTAAWMTLPDRRQLQNGDSFGDKADRFAQRISRDQEGIRVLSQSGIAFVRTKKSYLSLLSNYHSEIHRHSDDLSFDLYEDGSRVISDTGIPDKDFGTPYLYAISNSAHSVVQVDGADFPRDREHAYGSGLLASGQGNGWSALLATNPTVAAQGVDHQRLLLYKPGSALIVADRLRSGSPHTYRSLFQVGPEWNLQPADGGVTLGSDGDRIRIFNDSTDPELKLDAVKGQEDPLLGYVWEDFRDRDARWVESTTAEAADVDNVTTFSIDPKVEIHATATGPLGDTSAFTVAEDGQPVKVVTVTRNGGELQVQEADAAAPTP